MPIKSGILKEETGNNGRMALTRDSILKMLWCLGLALFWVVFLWRFWEMGVFILGLNAFAFFFAFLALFVWALYRSKNYRRKDLYWIIPLGLIALSYWLYENPFIKAVNLPVYPLLFIFFINYGFFRDKDKRPWNLDLLFRFIARAFSFSGRIIEALNLYIDMLSPKNRRGQKTLRQIILGLILFLAVALVAVIPLLSSADPVFGDKLSFVYDLIKQYIGEDTVYRTGFFLAFSLLLFSSLLAWTSEFDHPEKPARSSRVDSIIAGIVLGGILALYLFFLWVQLERLWVGSLPFEFRETEALVKSGFWQLFFLTGLNVMVYFFTYRKTNALVQKILTAFTAASLLLLVSAGQRLGLYVVNYGFSYEKFFATYTVIYSAILFIWLFFAMFRKERANIFKFMAFLFLWMYSIITVFPTEQFILRSNAALAKRPESRIRLYELTMLSSDVLGTVKRYKAEGRLEEKKLFFEREKATDANNVFDWQPWIERQEQRLAKKRWYESNL